MMGSYKRCGPIVAPTDSAEECLFARTTIVMAIIMTNAMPD